MFNTLHKMIVLIASLMKNIQTYSFTNSTKDYYYNQIYPQILQNNTEIVKEIISSLDSYQLNNKIYDEQFNVCTNSLCKSFTSIVDATPVQYYAYQTFIENSLDSMVALTQYLTNDSENIKNNGMMGYSLSINDGVPNNQKIYQWFKQILVNIQMYNANGIAIYNAFTIAGQEGFLMLNHIQSKQLASYVQDNGNNTSSPSYTDQQFADKLSEDTFSRLAGYYSAGYYMLQYCFQDDDSLAPGNLYTYLKRQYYLIPQIIAITNIDGSVFVGCDGGFDFIAANITSLNNKSMSKQQASKIVKQIFSQKPYYHALQGNTSEVQTGCRINETKLVASDPRIVQVDQKLQNIQFTNDINKFQQTLKMYPFRNALTVALMSGNYDSMNSAEQYCISIRDSSSTVVSCNDPPGPQNAAAVACSVILIAIIVGLWVWGCLNVKKDKLKDKANILRQIDYVSTDESVQTKNTQIM